MVDQVVQGAEMTSMCNHVNILEAMNTMNPLQIAFTATIREIEMAAIMRHITMITGK